MVDTFVHIECERDDSFVFLDVRLSRSSIIVRKHQKFHE